jgi:LysM domain-containing protein
MGKYNASPYHFKRARPLAVAVAAALLTVACAGSPEKEETPPPPDGAVAVPSTPYDPNANVEAVADIGQATAAAGDLSLRRDAPLHYVVKKGDTLWGISSYYLRDPWQWPELWYVNGQIANPHLIYPGELLTLVLVNGQPRLMANTDRLSPQVRAEPLDQALPAIPIDAIREFLRGPRVVSKEEFEKAPYVVEFTDNHVIAGQNNGIYAKNLPDDKTLDWAVVKIGDPYRDPDNGKLLGYEAIPTGEAELRTYAKSASDLVLTKSIQEVQIGNRLLPVEKENFNGDFYPHAPSSKVEGRILTVYGGVMDIGQFDIIALSRGSDAGLDPGTVLGIFQQSRKVDDPYGNGKVTLPEQGAGTAMVFKVTPKVSYALVMNAYRPIHVLDKVRNPSPSKPNAD